MKIALYSALIMALSAMSAYAADSPAASDLLAAFTQGAEANKQLVAKIKTLVGAGQLTDEAAKAKLKEAGPVFGQSNMELGAAMAQLGQFLGVAQPQDMQGHPPY